MEELGHGMVACGERGMVVIACRYAETNGVIPLRRVYPREERAVPEATLLGWELRRGIDRRYDERHDAQWHRCPPTLGAVINDKGDDDATG